MRRVHFVGKINREIFSAIAPDITTDEVIITDERIEHIKQRHPGDYEKYLAFMIETIENPDFILRANKPNSALILKQFKIGESGYKVILRLKVSNDPDEYKNSVITFQKVEEKRYRRYTNSENVLYKRE